MQQDLDVIKNNSNKKNKPPKQVWEPKPPQIDTIHKNKAIPRQIQEEFFLCEKDIVEVFHLLYCWDNYLLKVLVWFVLIIGNSFVVIL